MSFEDLLIHTVEVYRRESVGNKRVTDRFGQQISINPRQHEIGGETLVHTYRCRAYMRSGGLVMEERMVDVFQRKWCMYTELDVDILEDDAIRVLDQNGHLVVALGKILESDIKYDSNGPHHIEYELWIQDGPESTS